MQALVQESCSSVQAIYSVVQVLCLQFREIGVRSGILCAVQASSLTTTQLQRVAIADLAHLEEVDQVEDEAAGAVHSLAHCLPRYCVEDADKEFFELFSNC